MDITYYIILFANLYMAQSAPLPNIDDMRLRIKEEPYLYVIPQYDFDINNQPTESEEFNNNGNLEDSNIEKLNSVPDDLHTSQLRYRVYRPYVRYAQFSRRTFNVNRPFYPLSNYANDYDRFPTVA